MVYFKVAMVDFAGFSKQLHSFPYIGALICFSPDTLDLLRCYSNLSKLFKKFLSHFEWHTASNQVVNVEKRLQNEL